LKRGLTRPEGLSLRPEEQKRDWGSKDGQIAPFPPARGLEHRPPNSSAIF